MKLFRRILIGTACLSFAILVVSLYVPPSRSYVSPDGKTILGIEDLPSGGSEIYEFIPGLHLFKHAPIAYLDRGRFIRCDWQSNRHCIVTMTTDALSHEGLPKTVFGATLEYRRQPVTGQADN